MLFKTKCIFASLLPLVDTTVITLELKTLVTHTGALKSPSKELIFECGGFSRKDYHVSSIHLLYNITLKHIVRGCRMLWSITSAMKIHVFHVPLARTLRIALTNKSLALTRVKWPYFLFLYLSFLCDLRVLLDVSPKSKLQVQKNKTFLNC